MKTTVQAAFLLVLLVLLAAAGCASDTATMKHTDFLGDYSELRPMKSGRGGYSYIRPDLNLADYRQIIVDPVVFWIDESAPYKGISADELKRVADRFHALLVTEAGKSFKVVTQPGPGVLRLRTAITGIVPQGTVGITGSDSAGRVVRPGLTKPGDTPDAYIQVSGASAEMELLDSATNERLAAGIDRKGQTLSPGSSRWATVDAVLQYWATGVGNRLARLSSR